MPAEGWDRPGAGHGHTPLWILGHLAVTAEVGQRLLGGTFQHPEWLRLFGPGTPGDRPLADQVDPAQLIAAVPDGYGQLQELARQAESSVLERPHGVALFEGTPVRTVGDAVTLLLTNHFGFHLAQLSSCRREAGHPPLF